MNNHKKYIICITLSFIMLFTGMCSTLERTDSFLSFSQLTSKIDTIQSVSNDTLSILTSGDKLITSLKDTLLRSQRRPTSITLRNYAEFLWVKKVLQIFSSICITALFIYQLTEHSKTIILTYIHNQDGEK